jgi:hypothetical protein
VHHAHRIIQRARENVGVQREDREMAKHSAEDRARTAQLKASATIKGRQTLPKSAAKPVERSTGYVAPPIPRTGTPRT